MDYRIKTITRPDGTVRTDGRYPLRIGRVVSGEDSIIKIGKCAFLYYLTDENGEKCIGKCLKTSIVQSFDTNYEDMSMTIRTLNSIYVLEPVL